MKHFVVLGMVFLPSISHLILYLFRREFLHLKLCAVGFLAMFTIFVAAAPFFTVSMEIPVALLSLLLILLYFLYFEINQESAPARLSVEFKTYAFKIYAVSVFLMLTGLAALAKLLPLPVSGFVYSILGFLGIQFVFFWKLKLIVAGEVSVDIQNYTGRTQDIILDKEELSLLALLIEGKTDKEISELLYRSQPTVKKQLSNLYKKMKVKNRTEAVVYYNRSIKKDI